MPDPPNRKPPYDPSFGAHHDPYAQDGALSDYFSEGPAPASPNEFIDADAATRVANGRSLMHQHVSGQYPSADPYYDAPQAGLGLPTAPGGWQDGDENVTLDSEELRRHLPPGYGPPDPYHDGYYHDPTMGEPIPSVGGEVIDSSYVASQAQEYGLVPTSAQSVREIPLGGGGASGGAQSFSWIRVNAADHMAPPSPDLAMLSNADGFAAAQYRALRYRLEQEPNVQVVVVTSPREGDGKSVTAANLALALAEGGRIQVLLIDAALRNPAQHTLFGIRGDLGLTSVLAARQNDPSLPIDVIRISTSLSLIPAGPPVQSAYAALSSEPAAVLMGQIRKEFRYIIVDSSPVFGTAETLAWHSMIDKYILLARAGKSTTEDLTRACDRLQRDHILGVSFIGGIIKRH